MSGFGNIGIRYTEKFAVLLFSLLAIWVSVGLLGIFQQRHIPQSREQATCTWECAQDLLASILQKTMKIPGFWSILDKGEPACTSKVLAGAGMLPAVLKTFS